MAGNVIGVVDMFCTIDRDIGGGVMHPIFYFSVLGELTGTQPTGCSARLFGIDLSTEFGKSIRDQLFYADSKGLAVQVGGADVLVNGHPSEKVLFVYTVNG